VKLTVKGASGGTFVEFDCDGFKSLTVSGEFEFCQNWIVPEGPDGESIDLFSRLVWLLSSVQAEATLEIPEAGTYFHGFTDFVPQADSVFVPEDEVSFHASYGVFYYNSCP
jgi:hypothetical protein